MVKIGFSTKYGCGCDLHARSLTLHVIDKNKRVMLHTQIESIPEAFRKAVLPFQRSLTVCCESTFNWYWLSDCCRKLGIPFRLGHALYIKRSRQGKHKNDNIDAEQCIDLLHRDAFPLAYDYPPKMRAARDLMRRRMYFVQKRAAAFAHIQGTFYQQGLLIENLSDLLKRKLTRRSVLKHSPDSIVKQSLIADFDLIDALDPIIKQLESLVAESAVTHDKKSLQILRSMTGLGPITALTMLYEIHTITRFPSVQNFSSYCRTVKAQCESAGKPVGVGDNKIGNPTLKWAMCEAANHLVEYSPNVAKWYDRLKHRKGPRRARSILIHKIAIAIYLMLKNGTLFDEKQFIGSTNKSTCDIAKS